MSKKSFYIGDFKISHSTEYGGCEAISKLKPGAKLNIIYEPSDKVIVVQSKDKDLKKKVEIGELELPEQVRKVMVPLLLGKYKEDLFECEFCSLEPKEKSFENLRVTIWAK